MSDFAKLRQKSSIQNLTTALNSQNKFSRDERYWEPTVDKAGNGFAEIRFLPTPPQDNADGDAPFVTMFSHSFKGPTGQWYIENSLTTIGLDDPVSELNSKLWNSGVEANQNKARDQKRRLGYISNILVVNDPGNPANNGKVFLFRYGKKVMDKIKDKNGTGSEVKPEFQDPDDIKFNPYNPWEGANFKLNIRQVDGFRNYDKSEFRTPSQLAKTDKEIEVIWRQQYSLKAEIASDKFKSYDELKKKLERVLGLTSTGTSSSTSSARRTAEEVSHEDSDREEPLAASVAAEVNTATKSTTSSDDDEFADFAKLADA
jgi:hypothetical protein